MPKGSIKVFTELSGFAAADAWLKDMIMQAGPVYLVGSAVEYSVYVEFGTSKMAAQPYLFPAAEAALQEIHQIWENVGYDIHALIRTLALRIEAYAKMRCPVDTGNLRASITAERIK